jgi:hypothetical protein
MEMRNFHKKAQLSKNPPGFTGFGMLVFILLLPNSSAFGGTADGQ